MCKGIGRRAKLGATTQGQWLGYKVEQSQLPGEWKEETWVNSEEETVSFSF